MHIVHRRRQIRVHRINNLAPHSWECRKARFDITLINDQTLIFRRPLAFSAARDLRAQQHLDGFVLPIRRGISSSKNFQIISLWARESGETPRRAWAYCWQTQRDKYHSRWSCRRFPFGIPKKTCLFLLSTLVVIVSVAATFVRPWNSLGNYCARFALDGK